MIHHSEQNYVSSNTVTTENLHISIDRYLEIEQEVLWLRSHVCGGSTPPAKLARELRKKSNRAHAELLTEIKSLSEKLARLKAQNEVLNNCWLKEQENHTRAQTEVRVWAGRAAFKDSEIGELRRRVEELEAHLNPSGEVA